MDTMNDEQREILVKFSEVIKDVRNFRHDDHALYKWLKARNFNIKKAEAMYRKSMAWRAEIGADTILETFHPPPVMVKYFPGGFCGSDKEGRPIWIDPMGHADLVGMMYSVKKSDIIRSIVYNIESLYAVFRKCTKEQGRQIDQCVDIIDLDGFSPKRFMWKPVLDLYTEMLHIMEDNYPETLRRTYFVNAPKIFKMGYSIVTRFMDKETAKKLKFLDSNWKEELQDIIDPKDVPVHYGGLRTDEDGNEKCEALICYGGEVPKELYHKKEDFFHTTPTQASLGRGETLTLAYYIPDTKHMLRYAFAIDHRDLEFVCYLDPAGSQADVAQTSKTRLPDPESLDVMQPLVKYQCQRVPEDGMVFFDKAGVCYIQFRNPSRIFKRVVSHAINVELIDTDDQRNDRHAEDVANENTS